MVKTFNSWLRESIEKTSGQALSDSDKFDSVIYASRVQEGQSIPAPSVAIKSRSVFRDPLTSAVKIPVSLRVYSPRGIVSFETVVGGFKVRRLADNRTITLTNISSSPNSDSKRIDGVWELDLTNLSDLDNGVYALEANPSIANITGESIDRELLLSYLRIDLNSNNQPPQDTLPPTYEILSSEGLSSTLVEPGEVSISVRFSDPSQVDSDKLRTAIELVNPENEISTILPEGLSTDNDSQLEATWRASILRSNPNGQYQIRTKPNFISDVLGNAISTSRFLGEFSVDIPDLVDRLEKPTDPPIFVTTDTNDPPQTTSLTPSFTGSNVLPNTQINLYANGNLAGTGVSNSSGEYAITVNQGSVTVGTLNFTVSQGAGEYESERSDAGTRVEIVGNPNAIQVEITNPIPIPTLTEPKDVDIDITVSSSESFLIYNRMKTGFTFTIEATGFSRNLIRVETSPQENAQSISGTWRIPASDYSSADNGVFTIKAKKNIADVNGNKLDDSDDIVIAQFDVAMTNVPRLPRLNAPTIRNAQGEEITQTTEFRPHFTGNDAVGDAIVNLYVDGTKRTTVTNVADSQGNYDLVPINDVPAGIASYSVTQGTGEAEGLESDDTELNVDLPAPPPEDRDPVPLGDLPDNVLYQRVLPRNNCGGNLNATRVRNYDKVNKKQFAKAWRETGIGSLRWPGGDVGNFFTLEGESMIQNANEVLPGNPAYTHTRNPKLPNALAYSVFRTDMTFQNLKDIMDFAGTDLGECNWVINVLTHTPAQEIRGLQLAESVGLRVDRIEIGNELYFDQPNYKGISAFDADKGERYFFTDPDTGDQVPVGHATNVEYAEDLRDRWIPALRAAFPDAKLYSVGLESASYSPGNERAYFWNEKQVDIGLFDKSSPPFLDGITHHPYINMANLGGSLSDVGSITRAAQIGISAYEEMEKILDSYSLNILPDDTEILWTEWGILEGSNVFNTVILGGSWIGCLVLNMLRLQLINDTRTVQNLLHSIISSPQWAMICDEAGSSVDPALRGVVDRPYTQGIYPGLVEAFQGWALGVSANAVLNRGGNYYLLVSQPGYMAARVVNPDNDSIVVINTSNFEQIFFPPEATSGETVWSRETYVTDPWLTPLSPAEFPEPSLGTIPNGGSLIVEPFSMTILRGDLNAGLDGNPQNNLDRTPPSIFSSEVSLDTGRAITEEIDFTQLSSLDDLPNGWRTQGNPEKFHLNTAEYGQGLLMQAGQTTRGNNISSPYFPLRNGQIIEVDFIAANPATGETIGSYIGLNFISFSTTETPSIIWNSKNTLFLSLLRGANERLTVAETGALCQFRLIVAGSDVIFEARRDYNDGLGFVTKQSFRKTLSGESWLASRVIAAGAYANCQILRMQY